MYTLERAYMKADDYEQWVSLGVRKRERVSEREGQ